MVMIDVVLMSVVYDVRGRYMSGIILRPPMKTHLLNPIPQSRCNNGYEGKVSFPASKRYIYMISLIAICIHTPSARQSTCVHHLYPERMHLRQSDRQEYCNMH